MYKQLIVTLSAILCFTSLFAKQKVENFNTEQPSLFYQNKGQIIDQDRKVRKDVRYHYSAPGFSLSITDKGMSWTVSKSDKFEKKGIERHNTKEALTPSKVDRGILNHENDSFVFHNHRIDIEFVGANTIIPIEEAQVQEYYQNFYTEYTGEQGITNLHGAKQITLKNVWNGIDMVFQAKEEGKLEYDFVLHPNANIKDIQLKYKGQNGLQLIQNDLKIVTESGEVRESIPMSYEKENSKAVKVGYQFNNNIVSFETKSEYNKENTLVIDPQLAWGTYHHTYLEDISYEKNGFLYVTGWTTGSSNIASTGAYQTNLSGMWEAIISKFTDNGSRVWTTYFGGSNDDYIYDNKCDANGNIFVAGFSYSSSGIATSGTHLTSVNTGSADAFVAKFNSSGFRVWSTYYGGGSEDFLYGMTIDNTGNVYVTGRTTSDYGIATSGAYMTSHAGNDDVFIAKFNANGTLNWGTYLGLDEADIGYDIALDGSNNIIVTGNFSYSGNDDGSSISYYTATGYGHQFHSSGLNDGFLAKFSNSGTLTWFTFYGGYHDDQSFTVETDLSDNIYIGGATNSGNSISTSGAHQSTMSSLFDGFIAKFNPNADLIWGTYYGGTGDDYVSDINIHCSGYLYITGGSESNGGIATSGIHQNNRRGDMDAFMSKFSTAGSRVWGTYYGGIEREIGLGITTDPLENIYTTGHAFSSSGIATSGAFRTSLSSISQNGFINKIDNSNTCVQVNAGVNKSICSGNSIVIGTNSVSGHYYRWYTNNPYTFVSNLAKPSVSPINTTTYYLVDSISPCCYSIDSVVVIVNPIPTFTVNQIVSVVSGSSVQIGPAFNLGYTYNWAHGDTGSPIFVSPTTNTVYYNLTVVGAGGCKA